MTIQECYQQLGGDLSAVENRLRSVGLVERFLAKFLDDGCYATLCSAMEQGDRKQAFQAAHSLKGVSGNLSLDRLAHGNPPSGGIRHPPRGLPGLSERAGGIHLHHRHHPHVPLR